MFQNSIKNQFNNNFMNPNIVGNTNKLTKNLVEQHIKSCFNF
jgi:hypothetical protein